MVENHFRITCILGLLLAGTHIPLALGDPSPINLPVSIPEMQDGNYSSAKDGNPYQSRQKFKQYVMDKYKQTNNVESDVKQTQHGLSGSII